MNTFERYSNIFSCCGESTIPLEDVEISLREACANEFSVTPEKSGFQTDHTCDTEIEDSISGSEASDISRDDVISKIIILDVNSSGAGEEEDAANQDIICNDKNLTRLVARVKDLHEDDNNTEILNHEADDLLTGTGSSIGLCDNMHAECTSLSKEGPQVVLRISYSWPTYRERTIVNENSLGLKPLISERKRGKTSNNELVMVTVKATNICPMDLCIQRDDSFTSVDNLEKPFVLGSNFVGEVHHGIKMKKGTRVAGLVETGTNSRYVSTRLDNLVKVPDSLNSSDVVCVLTFYLPAFQALHHGLCPRRKYKKNSLRGKTVLLTSGASIMQITAMTQLARAADAKSVYVFCEPSQHEYVRKTLRSKPLDSTISDSLTSVPEPIDVIMDYDYSKHSIDISIVLSDEGRLVWITHPTIEEQSYLWQMQNFFHQATMCAIERASIYDIYQSWQTNSEETKDDTMYLFKLLSGRKIRPKIERHIALKDVQAAHEELLRNPNIRGAIVCEPWQDE